MFILGSLESAVDFLLVLIALFSLGVTAEALRAKIQCVSKKNIPDIFSCNSRKHCRIFIMFGTHVTEKVSNQQLLWFPTAPN